MTVYPLIPAYDDGEWSTEIAKEHGDDIFADAAIFNVEIEAPPEFTLITTGSCSTPQEGRWVCEAAPMRDFTMVLGENYERAAREVEGVVVNSYFYRQHAAGGEKALDVAVEAVRAFSELRPLPVHRAGRRRNAELPGRHGILKPLGG
jgi:hypothetical protein